MPTWIFTYYKQILFGTLFVAIFFTGWRVRDLQYAGKEVNRLENQIVENQARQSAIDVQSAVYENILSQINQDTYTLNQNLEDTYVNNSYRCLIPADGLRTLASAASSR